MIPSLFFADIYVELSMSCHLWRSHVRYMPRDFVLESFVSGLLSGVGTWYVDRGYDDGQETAKKLKPSHHSVFFLWLDLRNSSNPNFPISFQGVSGGVCFVFLVGLDSSWGPNLAGGESPSSTGSRTCLRLINNNNNNNSNSNSNSDSNSNSNSNNNKFVQNGKRMEKGETVLHGWESVEGWILLMES